MRLPKTSQIPFHNKYEKRTNICFNFHFHISRMDSINHMRYGQNFEALVG